MANTKTAWYAYLVQLDRPMGSERHQARYYLGIAKDYVQRLQQHTSGVGAKMLKAAAEQGLRMGIVQVWQFNSYTTARAFETWAKSKCKSHKRLLKRKNWQAFEAVAIALSGPIYVPILRP